MRRRTDQSRHGTLRHEFSRMDSAVRRGSFIIGSRSYGPRFLGEHVPGCSPPGALGPRFPGGLPIALVVFMRGVNIGAHKRFQPAVLARDLAHLGAVNIGAAGTFLIRES